MRSLYSAPFRWQEGGAIVVPCMPRSIEFFFDYSCPYAYLGEHTLEAIARETGVTPSYSPMFLGGVFRASGTPLRLMNELGAAKSAHNTRDMARWAELLGATLRVPENHPQRTAFALRVTLATECDPRVVRGFYRAYWVDGADLSLEETARQVLRAAGRHPADIEVRIAAAQSEALRDELRRRTDRAIALGVFGAPSFWVDEQQLFWGQDRAFLAAGVPFERLFPGKFPGTLSSKEAPAKEAKVMSHRLEVYWDFSSPFAYLGASQAESLAARTGATLVWRPMLLGGLFRAIGQVDVPLATFGPAKQVHVQHDLQRWARYWGVPFRMPSTFPVSSVKAMRAYLALPEARRHAFRDAAFRAYWAEDRNIGDEVVLRELLGDDADAVLAKIQDPAIKQELIACTDAAVKAGVFGAPTWVVDGEHLYWGQDRLPLVERHLTKGAL
jgi:2-hydroxychromene-2-carboxylate isomerase